MVVRGIPLHIPLIGAITQNRTFPKRGQLRRDIRIFTGGIQDFPILYNIKLQCLKVVVTAADILQCAYVNAHQQ